MFILWLMVTGISTHSLTKRLTTGVFYMENSAGYFNSQPHEEADWCSVSVRNNVHISTHSLTKRLTFFCFFLSECFHISTHSLTKRLTVWRVFRIADYSHFNSQPHEEADIRCSYNNVVYFISTHSLTKRLTVMEYRESKEDTFQLTASRRG